MTETRHYSDCAVHNEPAASAGPCDCGGYVPQIKSLNLQLETREDGGLFVWSDDVPGLILSGPDKNAVLEAIGPALAVLLPYYT